ncbi:IQ motif, EF-hand binding site [Trema orientale]|uniref:IQ motif, EF-hand binding site n=1 Tax=Trema orientale TaxID=63057 RepID=A0A2P5FKT6_TREOI|nr:IQ motif, EF-hand binding site [Trema orientale]
MGCLSAIVKRKKAKEGKSKQVKENLGSEESNGSHKELLSSSNEASSSGNATIVNEQMTAATRIQAAFRSFLARKVLHNLKGTVEDQHLDQDQIAKEEATATATGGVKGTVRFHEYVEDHSVKNQTMSALNHIHSWSRIQDQIRARRLCMVKEARIRQKNLENQLKLEAKLHELEVEWCGGSETMEEILSRIQQREEAAIKRERAMAYAFLHQWRANSSQYLGQASFSLGKEDWGWSWVERWVAARPWEIRVVSYPTNSKKTQTNQCGRHDKVVNQSEKKTSVSENSISQNGNCKNRKTCSMQPNQS